MEIHVIEQPSAALRTIVPSVLVRQAMLAIHLLDVSWNHQHQNRNAHTIMNVQHQKHVSIKCAEIHVLNAIHVVNMLSVVPYNIIRPAIVQLVGPVIHKFNVINVS